MTSSPHNCQKFDKTNAEKNIQWFIPSPHVYEELNGASLQFQIWIVIDSNLTKTIWWDAIYSLMEHEKYE
jgi:hypothetical protein